MNLKEFTERADGCAAQMEKEELQCFIHSIARKVPEPYREGFLELLEDVQAMAGAAADEKDFLTAAKKTDEKEIKKEMARLMALFEQIEEAELHLYAEGYEDYESGYWGGDWVWEYEDPSHACSVYTDGVNLIKRCINDGFYQEARELFDVMMESELYVENDWEAFSMGVDELADAKLIQVDLEELALEALYAVYQSCPPKMRAEELYGYFSISYFRKISLEQMLSLGREELPGLPEFWGSWIELLRQKSGDLETRLLKEAVLFWKGTEGILELARISYEKHPSLYLEALHGVEQAQDYAKQLEIGREALGKIDKKYLIRSQIALSTAEAAIKLKQAAYAQQCWLEAFLSDTSPINFLRLMIESDQPEQYRLQAEHIIEMAPKCGDGSYKPYNPYRVEKELDINQVSQSDLYILQFLSGKFDDVVKLLRQSKEPLGWTGTLIGCGAALLLLLLYQGEKLQKGCLSQMWILIHTFGFDAKTYYRGTACGTALSEDDDEHLANEEVFWQKFKEWRTAYVLEEKQVQSDLALLEALIDRRVKAIVSGKHRGSYGKAASLAAALGEVKESRGAFNAKQSTLQDYKMQFPRHTAFSKELRAYGMV